MADLGESDSNLELQPDLGQAYAMQGFGNAYVYLIRKFLGLCAARLGIEIGSRQYQLAGTLRQRVSILSERCVHTGDEEIVFL